MEAETEVKGLKHAWEVMKAANKEFRNSLCPAEEKCEYIDRSFPIFLVGTFPLVFFIYFTLSLLFLRKITHSPRDDPFGSIK